MPRSPARGFTLIEVLVATGILVTVAAGTAQLFALAVHQSAAARQQLVMSLAATEKIADLAATVAAADAPATTTGDLDRPVAGYSDLRVESGIALERRWLIAPLPAYSATAVLIAVRIRPRGLQGAVPLDVLTIREARTP